VILVNLGAESFAVTHGLRIAQLIIAPVASVRVVEVTVLEKTVRGVGGFGSTGVQ
jgi:dUTP pyrophosphatase